LLKKSLLLVALLMLTVGITVHAQEAKRLKVVASFTILADVVKNVAGDAADVDTLVPADADPHPYTPTPSDLAKISDADVVFVNGALLEQGLLKTIETSAKMVVLASECVEILPFGDAPPPVATTPDASDLSAQRCASHVSELDALGAVQPSYPVAPLGPLYAINCVAGAGDSEDGNCDPHVWFNPYNIELWTLMIRDSLSDFDPANADTYKANAAAYFEQLQMLSSDLQTELATLPAEKRILVTDHDALGYFAETYGFQIVGMVVPSVSTDAEPSAQQIAGLIDVIRAQHVPAIYAGVSVNPALSQQVANEAGAHFYTLYTESLTESSGKAPTYIDMMRTDMQTIVESLQ
jgi:ABC-type Zn uptake system ZnuABC Zn-binding protein ZnuA